MTNEDQHTDCKSLRLVTGRTADWDALACDCVCFANGAGGRLLIGIENGETLPPPGQVVPVELLDQLRKRVGELTVNVQALPSVRRVANGGRFALTQRERIVLGVLAQTDSITAKELAVRLEVAETDDLKSWTGRLLEFGLLETSGRTSGMKYFVTPALLRVAALEGRTTLSRISAHRLRAMILEDVTRYPGSSTPEINRRIGREISGKAIKRALDALIAAGSVAFEGERRWRRYRPATGAVKDKTTKTAS